MNYFASLPSPGQTGVFADFGWIVKKVAGLTGGVIDDAANNIFNALTAWVLKTSINMMGFIFPLVEEQFAIDVTGGWFGVVYNNVAAFTGGLLLLAFLCGVASSLMKGNIGELAGRVLIDLPKVVLLSGGLLAVTQITIELADAFSLAMIQQSFGADAKTFYGGYAQVVDTAEGSGVIGSFALMITGFIISITAMALTVFLIMRTAYIYVVLAFMPIVAVALVTPYKAIVRKMLEGLFGMIFAKAIVTIVMIVGFGAMTSAPDSIAGGWAATEFAVGEAPPEPDEPIPDCDDDDCEVVNNELHAGVIGRFLVGAVVLILALVTPIKFISMVPGLEAAGSNVSPGQVKGGMSQAPGAAAGRSARSSAASRKSARRVGKAMSKR